MVEKKKVREKEIIKKYAREKRKRRLEERKKDYKQVKKCKIC